MYFEEKLCVPEKLAERVLKAFHAHSGHVGTDRLCKRVRLRFVFPANFDLRGIAEKLGNAVIFVRQLTPLNFRSRGPS
jgi:hypothetical protein